MWYNYYNKRKGDGLNGRICSENSLWLGSQNYGLDTPNSDKDYKWIKVPSFDELFNKQVLTRQLDEHNSVWDIRDFFRYLKKAAPTALEALFSIEIEYFDEDFKNLMNEVRAKASSLVRSNWNGFVNGTKGMVYAGIKKEENPKTVSRFIFFYYLYQRILKTKTLGYLTWHSDYPGFELARAIRAENKLTEKDLQIFENIKARWEEREELRAEPHDALVVEEVEFLFKNYFSNYLTKI